MFGAEGRLRIAPDGPSYAVRVDDDGSLTGDGVVIEMVRLTAERYDRHPVGPPNGPSTYRTAEHLASPLSIYWLLGSILAPVTTVFAGDVPATGRDVVLPGESESVWRKRQP